MTLSSFRTGRARRSSRLAWALAGVLLFSTNMGHADDTKDLEKLFSTAQTLYEQKECASALPLFRKIYGQTKSPNARLYVARCLRDTGETTAAYNEMEATLIEAREKAEDEPRYAPTRDSAAAELSLLETQVARVVVALADDLVATRVTLNDQPLPIEKLGTPVAVAPGMVEVRVEYEGGEPLVKQEDVQAGETSSFAMAAVDVEAPVPDPVPVAPGGDSASGGEVRVAGFATLGIGLAGMAGFAVTYVMADARLSELEEDCGAARCTDPKFADVVDEGKRFELASNVMLGIGLAGIAAGTAMVIFGGPSEPDEPPPVTATVIPLDGGAAVGVFGSF